MTDPPFDSRGNMEQFVLESLDEIITLLKTIDHPQRLRILALMTDKPQTFKELMEQTRLQKSALGNHLNILSSENLIQKIDRGLYRVTDDGEAMFQHIAQSFLEIKLREQERLERIRRLIGKYTTYGDEVMSEETKVKIDLDVRIITLEPMRVASVQVISKSPEQDAWAKMQAWADKCGLLEDITEHPVFGFNNPDPSPDKEEYGYEFWIKIPPEIQPEGEMKEKEKIPRDLISAREACHYLGISLPTLYRYQKKGLLPSFKLGNRWKFSKKALDQWITERIREGVDKPQRRVK